MMLSWTEEAWQDYLYWQKIDKKTLHRINTLIKEIKTTPFKGTGKPEPLKHAFTGYWSRRIDREHRLVYAIKDQSIVMAQCRYHY